VLNLDHSPEGRRLAGGGCFGPQTESIANWCAEFRLQREGVATGPLLSRQDDIPVMDILDGLLR
jgi:hypothetical protein